MLSKDFQTGTRNEVVIIKSDKSCTEVYIRCHENIYEKNPSQGRRTGKGSSKLKPDS